MREKRFEQPWIIADASVSRNVAKRTAISRICIFVSRLHECDYDLTLDDLFFFYATDCVMRINIVFIVTRRDSGEVCLWKSAYNLLRAAGEAPLFCAITSVSSISFISSVAWPVYRYYRIHQFVTYAVGKLRRFDHFRSIRTIRFIGFSILIQKLEKI